MKTDEKRVALFATCLVDQVMPEVGAAAVRLLRRAGYQVDFPEKQSCCGQPFFNSGFLDEARRMAKATIEVFEPYDAVVLPSGSCTGMIRKEYPHLLQGSPRWYYPAQRLAAKTFELTEFLVHQAKWEPAASDPSPQPPVTYHDSCHMCRQLKLKDEPRQLLAAAGTPVQEMDESDRCCGFGGIFSIRMPEVSNQITAAKLGRAADTGANTIVTADPGCLMQMRGMAGDGQQIQHIATLLEEATR